MSRKTFRPQTLENDYGQDEKWLITQPIAVYYRQSTTAQVGNLSTSIQTLDMVKELERRGWRKEDIILIDDDEGVSGTTRIDERKGMSYLFELMMERKIAAVACQDEDRLFRDMTQIQVNIFIDTCRKSKVRVVTPYLTYDFSHPLHGEFHARQFRFKCDMAAEFITTYILGKLTPAKHRLLREGKWAGSSIPLGFIVDNRKQLPDGRENPNWRKYIPCEPYALIVREYFRIFLENGGAIRKTLRQIRSQQISFPKLPAPDGFKISNSKLKQRGDGYYLNRTSFVNLLTNPVYIGHWCMKGAIVVWDNHEPIIDHDVFMRAFNYLSPYTLIGEKNKDYKPAYQFERVSLSKERNVERPLCEGLIFTELERTYKAGVIYRHRDQAYLYVLNRSETDGTHTVWARRANWVDEAIVNRFRARLEATYNEEEWLKVFQEPIEANEHERKLKRMQIKSVEEEMENIVAGLSTLSHPPLILQSENRYKQLEQLHTQLTKEAAGLEQGRQKSFKLEEIRAIFWKVINEWDGMTNNERKFVLALFIDSIEALDYKRSGEMTLHVNWRDNTQEDIQLGHKSHLENWTRANTTRLLQLFDDQSSQLEIAAEFPKMKWYQLFNEIKKHRGAIRFPVVYMSKNETYEDYLAIGGRKGKATCSPWRPEEIALLKEMVERGASQLEIMEQFPIRRWKQMREKIKEIFGRLMDIPCQVPQDYTFHELVEELKTVEGELYSESPGPNFLWMLERAHDSLSLPNQASRQY
jgi:DNA invertase Pin-like site-specific DNA recombinase